MAPGRWWWMRTDAEMRGGWWTMIQAASANKAHYEYDKACKDEKSKNVPSNRINIWYRYIYTSHVYTCLYTDVDSLEDTPRQSKEFKGALPWIADDCDSRDCQKHLLARHGRASGSKAKKNKQVMYDLVPGFLSRRSLKICSKATAETCALHLVYGTVRKPVSYTHLTLPTILLV